ncbi:MAG: ATP-binding protein, partial [Planctomycetia bacterium]|nr:ATP-binding protein [Planctomycetia bacterium]
FQQTAKAEGTLILSVADTGVGVAKEDINRLYEPFVQLTRMRGTNLSNSGTGLGLPIVKKMITQMGGTITLDSKLGQGSTFKITIPRIKTDAQNIGEDLANSILSAGLCPKDEVPRILIVDDTPLNLKILSTMLMRLGVYNETTLSGQSALELLQNGNFNIVMTDLDMPEMTGEDLAKILRSTSEFAFLKIAVIVSDQDDKNFDHNLFDRIMEKPISKETLHDYIFGK